MTMLSSFLYIFFNLIYFSNPLVNTSWTYTSGDIKEVRIYSDRYFVVSKYNTENNSFISAVGGIYSFNEGYSEILEFDSSDSTNVGDTVFYKKVKVNVRNDSGKMSLDGMKYIKNIGDIQLAGSWLMSGIERRGEMRMRDVNRPRKTMKMLAGGRFQWIAYDISKKGFYGTGGGTYTAERGNYIENIEFFQETLTLLGSPWDLILKLKMEIGTIEGLALKEIQSMKFGLKENNNFLRMWRNW